MLNNPKDVNFEELKKILIQYGYEANNTGGSHWVFRHKTYETQVIPRKKPVKAIYVIRALKAIGEWK
jgi:predicted RNA binding protein YcfA (HicA-like mRNA interferase family)